MYPNHICCWWWLHPAQILHSSSSVVYFMLTRTPNTFIRFVMYAGFYRMLSGHGVWVLPLTQHKPNEYEFSFLNDGILSVSFHFSCNVRLTVHKNSVKCKLHVWCGADWVGVANNDTWVPSRRFCFGILTERSFSWHSICFDIWTKKKETN